MKAILITLALSTTLYAFESKLSKADKASLIDGKEQASYRKAGLYLNKAGRNYLETKNNLEKNQEYEVTMKCKAGSKKKCLLIRIDDYR